MIIKSLQFLFPKRHHFIDSPGEKDHGRNGYQAENYAENVPIGKISVKQNYAKKK